MTDEQLMTNYVSGDETAFAVLYDRYEAKVRRWVHYVVPKSDVADAAQETWIRLHRYGAGYSPDRPFGHWFFKVTINAANRFIHGRSTLVTTSTVNIVEPKDDGPAPDNLVARATMTANIYYIVCGLAHDHQTLVFGLFYRDKSIRHMAREMGMSLSVTRRLKREALRQLKLQLGPIYGDEI